MRRLILLLAATALALTVACGESFSAGDGSTSFAGTTSVAATSDGGGQPTVTGGEGGGGTTNSTSTTGAGGSGGEAASTMTGGGAGGAAGAGGQPTTSSSATGGSGGQAAAGGSGGAGGAACEPTSCVVEDVQCGVIDDGCGNQLDCGLYVRKVNADYDPVVAGSIDCPADHPKGWGCTDQPHHEQPKPDDGHGDCVPNMKTWHSNGWWLWCCTK